VVRAANPGGESDEINESRSDANLAISASKVLSVCVVWLGESRMDETGVIAGRVERESSVEDVVGRFSEGRAVDGRGEGRGLIVMEGVGSVAGGSSRMGSWIEGTASLRDDVAGRAWSGGCVAVPFADAVSRISRMSGSVPSRPAMKK
jgi:hypothetical protein